RSSTRARPLQAPRRGPAGEQADDEAEEESTDVRPPGDAAEAFAARGQADGAIEELEQEPPAQKQHRRQDKGGAEKERRHQRLDLREGIKTEVSTHDAGNRAAGANGQIGRASCRERGEVAGVAGEVKDII